MIDYGLAVCKLIQRYAILSYCLGVLAFVFKYSGESDMRFWREAARLSNFENRVAELSTINLDSIPRDTVGLGSKVTLEDLDDDGGAKTEFEIVVPEEVDPVANRISLSSPLGKSLIGKADGDDIEVQTPKGKRSYLVVKLQTIHQLLASENGAGGR